MEENKKDVLPLEGEPLTAPQISEPVVNALAAALSKIETYVPTQYINDGPPDIDADHLNHAEQAIMRVTNLANGAADAISALQSQVTQLNNNTDILENRINNTKRADDIEVFADGCEVGLTSFICHAETIGLPNPSYTSGAGLVLKRKQENVMVFLFSTNTTTALKCKNEGGWRDWAEYTKKSDLTNNLNHKKQILPWGNYRDGSYSISNFKFGSNLYIAVGASSRVQKRCSILAANDLILIPHPEGFVTIVFNDANHITVSGTTDNYQLREIRASDLLGV